MLNLLKHWHQHRAGATCLAGGQRDGAMHQATLLEGVPPECDVVKEEVFGPVVVIDRYATFKDAIAKCVAGSDTVPSGLHEVDGSSLCSGSSMSRICMPPAPCFLQ